MIQFEIKAIRPAAVSKNYDGQDTTKISVVVEIGVVGVPYHYGMNVSAQVICYIPNGSTKTQDQLDAALNASISQFMADNYPNIN